jgi:hypothetical protein
LLFILNGEEKMLIETVAASAIAILGPYLAKAGESFAEKAGETLAEKAGALYRAIKDKFKSDSDAEQTINLVEAKPDSKPRLATLEEVLTEKMKEDPDFATTVNRLVAEAKAADSGGVFVFGDRNIAVGGDASGTFITGDSNTVGKP